MSASRRPVYAFAGLLLAIVAILIVPLPAWLLDLLLGINVFGSALVLLLSVTVDDPLEFSAFAPALLVATLFRLSLDVSATRLILTAGATPGAVGSIIPAFGAFVVGGNLVVGLIVFAILVTIQFVVIASGSQRVAEVAARFTLDAMPGKQMAIDADVHAGVLDSEGARRKREVVQREADFYGAMDGAGKFVKGDAIAGFDGMAPTERRAAIREFIVWLNAEQDHEDFVVSMTALAAALDKAAAAHAALAQGSKVAIGTAFAELRAEIQNTVQIYQKYKGR